ncbi:THUMP domain-containing protein [Lujinxingia litoralis]|nr:THUMP domain-containing protein [Lujinxingia litoralis]
MSTTHAFFATCPRNLELLLEEELRGLGAKKVRQTVAGVHFEGPLQTGYRALLWSRLANSVLLELKRFAAPSPEALYDGVRTIAWDEHLAVDSTLAVNFTARNSQITHTKFGALKVKDAVVDQFRERFGSRPSVDLRRPDLKINCHVEKDQATLSIDLAGDSLHKRSYRADKGRAPLKENVAAAVLIRAGWPALAREGAPLFDPMCGSGTLLIEGALMAADCAPGLVRDDFGVDGWLQHDELAWARERARAQERFEAGRRGLGVYVGTDIQGSILRTARANTEKAGLDAIIRYSRKPVTEIVPPMHADRPGLVVTNAPYGERLGADGQAEQAHRELGASLKSRFGGWQASVLTGSKELGFELGVRADKIYSIYNGRLECKLLNFSLRA